jgi:hypothetical protein
VSLAVVHELLAVCFVSLSVVHELLAVCFVSLSVLFSQMAVCIVVCARARTVWAAAREDLALARRR